MKYVILITGASSGFGGSRATSSGKNLRATKRCTRVFSFVDDAHPPAAQLLDDAVVRDGLADELGWSDH